MCRNRKNITDETDMHEKNQRTEQKTCTSTGCIKSKDRMLILEKEEILKRWNKYIGELFHDKKKQLVIQRNIDELEILKTLSGNSTGQIEQKQSNVREL